MPVPRLSIINNVFKKIKYPANTVIAMRPSTTEEIEDYLAHEEVVSLPRAHTTLVIMHDRKLSEKERSRVYAQLDTILVALEVLGK